MKLFSRFMSRRGVEPKRAGGVRPVFTSVRPGHARATPRRYDRLAEEGFAKNVIVQRAVTIVARGVASVPLYVEKGGEKLVEHPLLALLKRPNPYVKGSSFFHQLVGHYLIAGNAYTVGVGPEATAPKELWLLRPDQVKIVEGEDGLPVAYRLSDGAKAWDYSADSVMHWKSFNPLSHLYGQAPLEAAATAVDAYNEGSRWNLALIQNGGTPSGVLYQEGDHDPLSEEQFQTLKKQVEDQYTGAGNAGRPLLLEGGLKWQDMGLSPKDMDWLNAKNMSAREIALAFGVPPQILGIPDSQTYSNYAEARLSVWEDTILPLLRELVGELNGWLAPHYGADCRLMPDLDDIPALEPKRQRRFERISNAAFLSEAEKRQMLGIEAVPAKTQASR